MIIGSKLIFLRNLPSTNTKAANLASNREIPEGTVVYTDFQSEGRGQMGNSWESEKDKNLLISIILHPTMIDPADQFIISMVISLGICDFLKRYLHSYSIKWPNDIYIGNDKIAGILIENSIIDNKIDTTVAGIGININQTEFISDAPNPVSLSMITGKTFDLTHCLEYLISDLDNRYKELLSGRLSAIRSNYVSLLYRLDVPGQFRDTDGLFEGRIKRVADDGRLLIEDNTGRIREYGFKDVDLIR